MLRNLTKKNFTPIPGDNITAISVSDDEKYVGIGSDGGLIYIFEAELVNVRKEMQ